MNLPPNLAALGFSSAAVQESDFDDYFRVKKACYSGYVNEYFGGWIDSVQLEMNAAQFRQAMRHSCNQKLLLHGETVGFFAYDEHADSIDGVSIQMLEQARNHGFGSWYLSHITAKGKPVTLKVFKTNPARHLYARFGFVPYDESLSHFFMRYEPT